MLEELPAVRQLRERVVRGEVQELQRALLDGGLEPLLVIARDLLCRREPLGHLVERAGERIELLDAAARHPLGRVAVGDALGGLHQPPDRSHDPNDHQHRQSEEQQQHARAQPDEKPTLPRRVERCRCRGYGARFGRRRRHGGNGRCGRGGGSVDGRDEAPLGGQRGQRGARRLEALGDSLPFPVGVQQGLARRHELIDEVATFAEPLAVPGGRAGLGLVVQRGEQ